MKYSRYAKYKDSGVEWLGEVPEGWNTQILKYLADYRVSNVDKIPNEDELPIRLCNYTDVYYNEQLSYDMPYMETTATQDEIQKFHLEVDDILITKDSEDWKDIAIPARIISTSDDFVCGYHLAIIRPRSSLSGEFLFRLLQSRQINHHFQIASNGITRYSLPKASIGNVLLPLPDNITQSKICKYIDFQSTIINALIAEQEKLITLLQEKRQAVISHAVTKGLNPDAPMKDSGVEWLGKVPVGWGLSRLKFCLKTSLQYGANEPAEMADINDPRYIRITDLNEDGSLRQDTFRSIPHYLAKSYLLHDGDILLARSGATVGKCFLYRANMGVAAYAGYLIKVSTNDLLMPDFFYLFLQSTHYWQWVNCIFIKSTIQNISAEKYNSLFFALPPIAEQEKIIEKMSYSRKAVDVLISESNNMVKLLQERRTALISAAVTGKIDVRGLAAMETA